MKVVGVRFKPAGKIYHFEKGDLELNDKDKVIVNTNNGFELAEVAISEIDVDKDDSREISKIIRRASSEDLDKADENKKDAIRAIEVCKEKVKKNGLDMKIIDANYSFDRSKLTFYFKSENRVDFRALVKELAAIYRNRIELRQMGVRDHAKMIDQFGTCGQKCCCTRFMTDFKPLSIKMAKNQDITLDPTKISGVCGRLMCCLSYEEDCYKMAKKIMPKQGQQVQTHDGEGVVLANDYIKHASKVRVKLTDSDQEIEKTYPIKEIKYSK
ncbi:MAG: regulatory iron-sulfur-containing complex subunit RicT [Anaerococcus sp.]|nr:stage 0 sporulation protein [Anaerococcus sp.]MDD7044182.1 regulatory iron-sulfur-containing complex subunit RicT [Peptoniphilaceae bacterium]MDY2918741.1 regulatory iron-sulfur-containing complex subunit RicT [Anaerococcus sp.]